MYPSSIYNLRKYCLLFAHDRLYRLIDHQGIIVDYTAIHQGHICILANCHDGSTREDASRGAQRRLPCTLFARYFCPVFANHTNNGLQVEVEDRPTPKIQKPTDAILKVTSTALCGSDLHFYRGHLKCPPNFICGHEFVGEIVEKGDDVKKFNIGDRVVVPFYTACGECFYCVRGQASRCSKGELFGNSAPANTVDGGQAEYVRCPLADSTFVIAPTDIPEEMLVLMADIFPTGYFAASRFLKDIPDRDRKEFTVVCIGCGPVAICAITCALTMVDNVIAIDSVPERLEEAKKLGAKVINLNDDPVPKIKEMSGGRGADVVMECVGHADAWQLAFDMIRPFGKISSIGVQ